MTPWPLGAHRDRVVNSADPPPARLDHSPGPGGGQFRWPRGPQGGHLHWPSTAARHGRIRPLPATAGPQSKDPFGAGSGRVPRNGTTPAQHASTACRDGALRWPGPSVHAVPQESRRKGTVSSCWSGSRERGSGFGFLISVAAASSAPSAPGRRTSNGATQAWPGPARIWAKVGLLGTARIAATGKLDPTPG